MHRRINNWDRKKQAFRQILGAGRSFQSTSGFGFSETLRDFLNATTSLICMTSSDNEPCASICAGNCSNRCGSAAKTLSDVSAGASTSSSFQNAENCVSVGSPSPYSKAFQLMPSISVPCSCTACAKASAAARLTCFDRGFCDCKWIDSLDRVLEDG